LTAALLPAKLQGSTDLGTVFNVPGTSADKWELIRKGRNFRVMRSIYTK
jgi:hypothetical protein